MLAELFGKYPVGIPLSEALYVSILGIVVVMIALAVLACCIVVISKVVGSLTVKKTPTLAPVASQAAPVSAPAPKKALPVADEVSLYSVDDEAAAMIMAIVADQLKKPVNELYFKSIKEV